MTSDDTSILDFDARSRSDVEISAFLKYASCYYHLLCFIPQCSASQWISWGVGKGAEKAGQLISKGSAKLRENLHPESQEKPIDPRVQKGMVYARKASHVAVSVSGYIGNT